MNLLPIHSIGRNAKVLLAYLQSESHPADPDDPAYYPVERIGEHQRNDGKGWFPILEYP